MLKMGLATPDILLQERTHPVATSNYYPIARMALIVCDVTAAVLAFVTAYWLRFDMQVALSRDIIPEFTKYFWLVVMLIPLWVGLFAAMRLYDFRTLLGGTNEYARALNACTVGMMILVLVSFFIDELEIARGWLVLSWLLSSLFVIIGRFVCRRIAYRLRRRGYFVTRAVILGTNEEALTLARYLADSNVSGLSILGFIDEQANDAGMPRTSHLFGLPILGTLSSLTEVLNSQDVHEVIVASTALHRRQLLETSQLLNVRPRTSMHVSSGLYEIFATSLTVTTHGSVPLLRLNRLRLDPLENLFKTLLDYCLIILCAPFLLVVFLVIGILIKLDSTGPIIYRRRVVGLGGKEFDAFKFRTMYTNGDEILLRHPTLRAELRANHKLKDDPRVTPIGKWLRRTSLDELPQLINVLFGQMSLVGPRMITAEETAQYGSMQHSLFTVKPGMTGLWQVSGRSDLAYQERVQIDMYYIRYYSLWLDLQILFIQTLPAILKSRGAY